MDIFSELALTNHGAMTRGHLRERAVSDRRIDHAISSGLLVPLFEGVFRHSAVAPTRQQDLTAVQMWAPEAFFSHRTGAEVLGLDGVAPHGIEICSWMPRRDPRVRVHRIQDNDRPPISVCKGLRLPTVERILLDLAAVVPYRSLGLAMDDALRKRLTTAVRLRQGLLAYGRRGKNGTVAYRSMVEIRDDVDGRLATKFEAKMRRILKRIERPHTAQHPVAEDMHLDFAYPDLKLGIECHSIKWHLGEERFKADARRDRRLRLLGWTILYFTWDDVHLAPARVEAEVRQAIRNLLPQPHER